MTGAIVCGAIAGSECGTGGAFAGGFFGVGVGYCVAHGIFKAVRVLASQKKLQGDRGSWIGIACLIIIAITAPFVAGGLSFFGALFLNTFLSQQ